MFQRRDALGPEAVAVLTDAFEKAWENFLHSYDRCPENWDRTRKELAAGVTASFKCGEMDSSRLAREALAELRRRELSHN